MFELNGTLVIFIASFLVFMTLLNQVMLKPIGRVLEQRAAKIKADLDAGKSARAQAEKVLDNYHEHLQKIRAEAQSIINEAVEKASYHRNVELSRVREEGQKKLDAAKAEIALERDSLMEALVKQELDLIASIAEKLLGEPVAVSLEPEKVRRALEEAC